MLQIKTKVQIEFPGFLYLKGSKSGEFAQKYNFNQKKSTS